MTICIAAIGRCEELGDFDEAIVFATDHMITLEQIGQFEHVMEKYKKINLNTIAMLSGEALLFEEILEGTSERDDLKTLKEKIHQNLIKIRENRLDKALLSRFRIDFQEIKELLKIPQHNNMVIEILETVKKFSLKTSIILAGFKDGEAQIYEIAEVGVVNTRDINFDAIGTGGIQAINTLLFQKHSKKDSLKKTLYNVYKAKKNSEVAKGVGKETDLFILTSKGILYELKKEHLKILESIYEKELNFGSNQSEIDSILKSLEEVKNA